MDINNEGIFERMMALLDSPSIEEMWESWLLIAQEVIPKNYDIADALEGSSLRFFDRPEEIDALDEEWIRCRVEYLSDRADPSRMYWLDWAIRYYLKKKPRDSECQN